jgi:hypothetical protein
MSDATTPRGHRRQLGGTLVLAAVCFGPLVGFLVYVAMQVWDPTLLLIPGTALVGTLAVYLLAKRYQPPAATAEPARPAGGDPSGAGEDKRSPEPLRNQAPPVWRWVTNLTIILFEFIGLYVILNHHHFSAPVIVLAVIFLLLGPVRLIWNGLLVDLLVLWALQRVRRRKTPRLRSLYEAARETMQGTQQRGDQLQAIREAAERREEEAAAAGGGRRGS